MSPNKPVDSEAEVRLVIEQVLDAERRSEADLKNARATAAATVGTAAERAAVIRARARARIVALHERCARALQNAIRQTEQAAAAEPAEARSDSDLTRGFAARVARGLLRDEHEHDSR